MVFDTKLLYLSSLPIHLGKQVSIKAISVKYGDLKQKVPTLLCTYIPLLHISSKLCKYRYSFSVDKNDMK